MRIAGSGPFPAGGGQRRTWLAQYCWNSTSYRGWVPTLSIVGTRIIFFFNHPCRWAHASTRMLYPVCIACSRNVDNSPRRLRICHSPSMVVRGLLAAAPASAINGYLWISNTLGHPVWPNRFLNLSEANNSLRRNPSGWILRGHGSSTTPRSDRP